MLIGKRNHTGRNLSEQTPMPVSQGMDVHIHTLFKRQKGCCLIVLIAVLKKDKKKRL